MKTKVLSCVVVSALALMTLAQAQEINVAAASDLQFALAEVAQNFQKTTGRVVKLNFGSSGNFYSQIQNGAPFDVFFSADVDYPAKLEAAGLTETGTLYRYAVGRLVLWVPNESKIDLSKGLKALADKSVGKVAIANPAHAPYGRAAVASLRSEGLYEAVESKLVQGENISQAATFVASGSADAGLLALSLALSPAMKGKGRYVEIPQAEYPALEQAAVILKSSHDKETARRFLEFLKTPGTMELLKNYGFAMPGK